MMKRYSTGLLTYPIALFSTPSVLMLPEKRRYILVDVDLRWYNSAKVTHVDTILQLPGKITWQVVT